MKYDVQVPVQDLDSPVVGYNGYQGLNPHTEVLPKGWCAKDSQKPLTCDILVEHDYSVTVRDGCKLYADIFRLPKSSEKIPAIICWSPFGKKFNGIASLKLMTPWNLGIPDGTLSGLEKFEAPDPADWVPRGYAIVNVDSRGAYDSEGTMAIMGTQEAEDGYDFIEAIAKEPWCNGNVGLAGNSHLAIIQWFIAALNPPSLKAMAPWEGCGDLYREQFARGGIYAGELFDKLIIKYMLRGRHGIESFQEMFRQHPLANKWWNDKRPDMKQIKIPTYITGTWTNTMHGMGAIRAWLEIPHSLKWLRWHAHQEWYDLWGNEQGKEELFTFFDHYLKGMENTWHATPRVRMAVLRFGDKDPISDVVEEDFPVARTQYRKLYLQPDHRLSFQGSPSVVHTVSYDSENKQDGATFTYTFSEITQVVGMPKAVLYMSCSDLNDMDVYLCLRKLSASGEQMLNFNLPWSAVPVSSIAEIPEKQRTEVILYAGPMGILRASHRRIDAARSMHENWPFHPHIEEEKIEPLGTIVRLEIGIWGMGVEYEAGESISLHISGHHSGVANFVESEYTNNKGKHVVHFGGEYDSHLVVPIV